MSDEIKEYLDTLKEIVGEGKSKGTYGISYWHWKEILDCITNLQQELDTTNEKWQKDKQFYNCRLEENVKLRKEKEDYKSRCEKAIEYLKENVAVYAFNNKKLPHWEFNDDNINDLLNILQGGKDE